MRKMWGLLAAMCAPAALLVASASATVELASGDTCTASGNGTSYTLSITLPANASPQGGFAFGAAGVTISNINIAAAPGTLSTENLPPNTSAQWVMSNPPKPGDSVTAVLTTSGPVTGSFTVVAATSPPSGTYFDPIACPLSAGRPAPSNAFTVDPRVRYNSAAAAWRLVVTVPGPGTVTGIQAVAAATGAGSKAVAGKSAVQAKKVVASAAGKYTLSLIPTAYGNSTIKKHGSLMIKITVAFNPTNGKSASKVLSLTLKK